MSRQATLLPQPDPPPSPEQQRQGYVRRVLRAYRSCPATVGHLLRNDRRLALKLFESAVPIDIVEAALAIAALRRAYRPADAPTLPKVRSLAYFLPVIDELMASPLEPGYLDYLACKLCSLTPHKDR